MTKSSPTEGIPVAKDVPAPRTRYEMADALYDQLIGWVSWQVGSESAKPEPDQAEVIRLNEQAAQLAADREALDPDDQAAVEAVIAEYADIVREFYPGRRGYPDWLRE
jgi:hypothetical protein